MNKLTEKEFSLFVDMLIRLQDSENKTLSRLVKSLYNLLSKDYFSTKEFIDY